MQNTRMHCSGTNAIFKDAADNRTSPWISGPFLFQCIGAAELKTKGPSSHSSRLGFSTAVTLLRSPPLGPHSLPALYARKLLEEDFLSQKWMAIKEDWLAVTR